LPGSASYEKLYETGNWNACLQMSSACLPGRLRTPWCLGIRMVSVFHRYCPSQASIIIRLLAT
jgi:hypothetical protein